MKTQEFDARHCMPRTLIMKTQEFDARNCMPRTLIMKLLAAKSSGQSRIISLVSEELW